MCEFEYISFWRPQYMFIIFIADFSNDRELFDTAARLKGKITILTGVMI